MRIGFVVNDVATELAEYTTTRLALSAVRMGHEPWYINVADFVYQADESLSTIAHRCSGKNYKTPERFLDGVIGSGGKRESVELDAFDVVVLRNDPAVDAVERPWAVTAGVAFGQMLAMAGVLVVNDPSHLALALNKAYFQHFPEAVRPRTLITRDEDVITKFVADQGGEAVLKPLQGSGGSGVFKLSKDESPNLNQIIEAIARDGYVVAQEYLPDAVDGDIRMFVMNGDPLQSGGKYAAFRRVNKGSDLRSNMSAGGKAGKVTVTDEMLQLVDLVRPKLLADGMFLVGLDIVGDKLMEINVFSPGGLGTCQGLYQTNFADVVIAELERKVLLGQHYERLPNHRWATL